MLKEEDNAVADDPWENGVMQTILEHDQNSATKLPSTQKLALCKWMGVPLSRLGRHIRRKG
eukprot:6461881-Ditylum_brightwellii.AAC.1